MRISDWSSDVCSSDLRGDRVVGDFEGKIILITGAASGLGRAAGTGFAQEDAILCLADLDADGLAEICRADPREGRNRLRDGSGSTWYDGGMYPCRAGGSGGVRRIGPDLERRRPATHTSVGGRKLGRLDTGGLGYPQRTGYNQ